MQFHYRSTIDFSNDAISSAQKQLEKITDFVQSVRKVTNERLSPTGEIKESFDACVMAMNDDFNSPVLIAEILKLIRSGAKFVSDGDKQACAELNYVIHAMLEDVLGLKFDQVKPEEDAIPEKIKRLAQKRWQAKQNKDFATADSIRVQLLDAGYTIKDSKDGYEITKS